MLKVRIGSRLAPDKAEITKAEIIKVAKKRSAVTKAIAAEGLPSRQANFARDEAISVITRVLTTPRKDFQHGSTYDKSRLRVSFKIDPKKLDELSDAAGFDWSQNSTVDSNTALAIRGLAQLDKPSKRKRS